jgi:hypothetical protein
MVFLESWFTCYKDIPRDVKICGEFILLPDQATQGDVLYVFQLSRNNIQ